MTLRVKALVCAVVVGGILSFYSAIGYPAQQWLHFSVYLAAVLLSSGMKVALPKTEGTMSANFPFIFLGILQLSPLQAVALAVCNVLAQCRIRVIKPFTLTQILFNVANVVTATVLTWYTNEFLILHRVQMVPAIAVAATVYFFANTAPVALIIGWDSDTCPYSQWRQNHLWYLPFYLAGAVLAAVFNLVGVYFSWITSLLLIPLVYTMYRAYNTQIEAVRDRERHIDEIEALQFRTIEGLAMAIEAKDQNTHRHLMRVRTYVSELGRIMGLDDALMKALLTASFLHDIGKLAVPEYILNKPGRLTPEEFEKMKIHPVVGAEILERVRFPYPVVPIVRSHHEAWDGSGYPDGLKGADIPIGARILTAVDCFDALASERPYRKALPLNEAIEFVRAKAGTQFDPEVVRLLELHYLDLEEKAHRHIEEIEPLKTDPVVDRGSAPGAGFEVEVAAQKPIEATPSSKVDLIAQSAERPAAPEKKRDRSQVGSQTGSILARRLRQLIAFDCFALYLVSGDVILPHFVDGPSARGFSSQPIPIGEGLSGWVVRNERSIKNGNPTVEPNYRSDSGLFSATSSALSVPLIDAHGDAFGALSVYSAQQAAFSPSDLRILQNLQSEFSPLLRDILRFEVMGASTHTIGASKIRDIESAHVRGNDTPPQLRSSAAS